MRFLKLFENYITIKEDLKDILNYLEDDFDLEVKITENSKKFEIVISAPKKSKYNHKYVLTMNEEINSILDVLINYCNNNELKFKINLYHKINDCLRGKAYINKNNKKITCLILKNYGEQTKEIKSLSDVKARFVNYITIEIVKPS